MTFFIPLVLTLRMLEWSQTPKDSEAGVLFSGNVKMFRDCTSTEVWIHHNQWLSLNVFHIQDRCIFLFISLKDYY